MRTDLTEITAPDELVVELTSIFPAGPESLTAYLTDQGAWRKGIPSLVDRSLAGAHAQTARLPGEATTTVLIKRLARQLLDLDRDIETTHKLITERFRAHPQAMIIEGLPGLGPILGAEFLVRTGATLSGFASAGRLASSAGLVLVPQDSGRVSGNLRRPKPSRTFYHNKRGERLIHTQALLSPARRLFTPTATSPNISAA